VEGLQVVPQKFNNCGPSNLSINLSFYGHHVDQLEIADILKPSYYDRNVGPQELVAYVNEYTPLKASLFQGGDLPLLKRLLSSGFPVVIEEGITPSEREGWMGHYLTLNGYDDIAEEFRALDTLLGPWDGSGRSISYETTIRQWAHFNYTFFVVYPLELEETVFEILGPEMLYPAMMWRRASLQAQAELEANVDNPFAWYNLGTSLTRWGQLASRPELLRDAAAAFDQARAIGLPPRMLWYQFEPYVAYLSVGRIDDVLALTDATLVSGGGRDIEETHYYRGNALMARGDREGAREAYERALQLNPGFGLAREALDRAG
jgi:tetratricopeptide (TPR) repeat protein